MQQAKKFNPVVLLIVAFPLQFSNCFKLYSQDLQHYDIISFGKVTEDLEVGYHHIHDNQVSILRLNQSVRTFSSYLQMAFCYNGSNSNLYGRVISIHTPKNWTDALADLFEIEEFYKSRYSWKPYFFIRLPEEGLIDSNSHKNLLIGLSLQLPVTSDVYFVSKSPSNHWWMTEIYSLKNLTIVQPVHNAFMRDIDQSMDFNVLLQKGVRRSNFQGVPIIAVAMDSRGYELVVDFEDDNTTTGFHFSGGLLIEEYWFFRDALNFSESALKGTGSVQRGPGGTLTGMGLAINQEKADLGVSGLEFLEFRAFGPHGISYLHPILHSPMLAFFKQPPVSSIRDIFLSTFSSEVWLMLLGLWIAVTASMRLTLGIYSKYKEDIDDLDVKMSKEISIWATGAVCQQAWSFTPRSIGGRTIFMVGWLSRCLCFAAFSASLVSLLTFEVLPIQSFNDLLKENFYIYNDGHIPTTRIYVEGLQENGKIAKALRNVDIEKTIAAIATTRSTMVSLSDSFYPNIRKEGYSDHFACNVLSVVTVGTRPVKMSMFVKKASPLREVFNHKILVMAERGIQGRMIRNYFLKANVKCVKENSGFHSSQSSKDVFTAYLILLVGFGVALILGGVEVLFRKMGTCTHNCRILRRNSFW